ncbi:MAG: hypothetical protein DMG11_08065 [Acidobacteria bacterium]|nr:MAG: hypothetical protein DMG11_08065 [Acidobacteriota bacterium]
MDHYLAATDTRVRGNEMRSYSIHQNTRFNGAADARPAASMARTVKVTLVTSNHGSRLITTLLIALFEPFERFFCERFSL